MKAVNVTLLFDGEAEAAFNLYKSVFGGEFSNVQRLKDMPSPEGLPAGDLNKILHMSLPIGNSVINGMDMPAGRGTLNKGNNFMVAVDTESEEETERAFNGLAEGATIMMPIAHQFWGAYFGMLIDKFGVQWMFSYVK
jgi:PhnB protein